MNIKYNEKEYKAIINRLPDKNAYVSWRRVCFISKAVVSLWIIMAIMTPFVGYIVSRLTHPVLGLFVTIIYILFAITVCYGIAVITDNYLNGKYTIDTNGVLYKIKT